MISIKFKGKGNWCFQCDGMAHLKYCDKVSKCLDEAEVF
jgi:hypothetical protein